MQFLIGLMLISQLFAGAKDCNTRRDCEETPTGAYQTQVAPNTTYNKNIVK